MTDPIERTRRRSSRHAFLLAVRLARRPGFCCCCWCLELPDALRARRIFKLVRAIDRANRSRPRR